MRILITNDDGIDAPGLQRLVAVCAEFAEEIMVVAPGEERSGSSHGATTHAPIRVERVSEQRIAVDGTPADCVRLALTEFFPEPDWVLAGINRGGNLGVDVFLSGTVGAAREAAILGRKALAVSLFVRREAPLDWDLAGRRAAHLLRDLLGRPPAPRTFWNLNLPCPDHDLPEVELVECPFDPSPLDVRFEKVGSAFRFAGDYRERPRLPGHDVAVCFGGRATLTSLEIAPLPKT